MENFLFNNTILICPKSESKRLIAEKSKNAPDLKIKFFDKAEILKGVYFDYGLDAVDYVSRKYHLSLENSEEILRNAHNVIDLNDKTRKVRDIFRDLSQNQMLKINPRFKLLFQNKKVVVSGYSFLDKELRHALSLLTENVQYVSEENENIRRNIFNFESIEDEVNWVFEEICKLVENGTNLNDIFVFELKPEYLILFKKYSRYYNLPIQFNEDRKLVDSPIYHEFTKLLGDHSINDSYQILKERFYDDKFDSLGKLADSINECSFASGDFDHFKKILSYVAGKTSLRCPVINPSVKIADEFLRINENQHVFVLGFSLGTFPRVSLDNDFYSDEEKTLLDLNDSKTKSAIDLDNLISFLNSNNNIHISRTRKMQNQKFYDSPIVNLLGFTNSDGIFENEFHSLQVAQYRVGKAMDLLRFYNIDSSYVDSYTEKELLYSSYDPSFKGLENFALPINFHLSYTALNEFNLCPFEFFLKRVLGLNTFESNFFSNIGTLFHNILEDSIHKEVDLNDHSGFISKNFVTEQEKFFVDILLPQAFEVINKNKSFLNQSKFTHCLTEERIEIDLEPGIRFTGIIDKILIDEECKNLIVVDYKTSDFSYVENDASHGIDMQLPIYAYLLKEQYPEYQVCGLYIQNVLFDKFKKEKSEKDYIPYLLNGLSLFDVDVAKRIDTNLGQAFDQNGEIISDSSFVRNFKLTAKGELSKGNTKTLLDKYSMEQKIQLTKNLILLALKDIKNADFNIRPIGDSNESPCSMCGCRDICYFRPFDLLDAKLYYEQVDQKLSEFSMEGENDEI